MGFFLQLIVSFSSDIWLTNVCFAPQAVVQYMADLVDKRDVKPQPVKKKKSWAQICFFSGSNKRKRNGMDYVQA